MSKLPAWALTVGGVTYGTGRPLLLSTQPLPKQARVWSPDIYTKRRRTVFDLSDRITGFKYESEEDKQDKVTLTVENQDLGYFESPVLMKGTAFTFLYGYSGGLAPGGEVTVQGIRGFEQLQIEAYGKAPGITTEQRTTTWEKMTRSKIVEVIARFHQIPRTRISEKFAVETISQTGITDWRFLLELAEPFGYSVFFTIEQGVRVLNWRFRPHVSTPARIFEWGQPGKAFRRGSASAPLLRFSIDDSKDKGKPAKVDVSGHDPDARKPLRFTGSRGTASLGPVLGPVTEVVTPEESAGQNESVVLKRATAHSSFAEVRQEAVGRYRRAQEDQMLVTAIVEGDPTITLGQIVEIARVPEYVAGNYYVRKVKHSIASDGYKTTMGLTRNAVGRKPTGAGKQAPSPGVPNKKSAKDIDPNALVPRSGIDRDQQPVIIFGPSNLAG